MCGGIAHHWLQMLTAQGKTIQVEKLNKAQFFFHMCGYQLTFCLTLKELEIKWWCKDNCTKKLDCLITFLTNFLTSGPFVFKKKKLFKRINMLCHNLVSCYSHKLNDNWMGFYVIKQHKKTQNCKVERNISNFDTYFIKVLPVFHSNNLSQIPWYNPANLIANYKINHTTYEQLSCEDLGGLVEEKH